MSTIDPITSAAMCLWEYCLDYRPPACEAFRGLHGVCETRDRVQGFAKSCHESWEHAQAVLGFDAPFDWEWVPAWFDICVDNDFDLVVMDCTTQAHLVMESFNAKV